MKRVMGWLILSLPFAAMFAFVLWLDGWLVAIGIFSSVALVMGVIMLGIYLIQT